MTTGHVLLPPPATTASPEQQAKTRDAAAKFEAMAINQLLAPMFDTVDTSGGLFGGGEAEQAWRPMLISEIAKKIAQAGGLGLAEPVYQQMLRMQETQGETKP